MVISEKLTSQRQALGPPGTGPENSF